MRQQLQQILICYHYNYISHNFCTCAVGSSILSSDMLEGHTNMVQVVVVQWGTEQVVVVQWGTEQVVVVRSTEQEVALQEDKELGVAECTQQEVVLQEHRGLGVAEGRTWDRGLEVAEGRTWDTELGVAEGRTWDTGGQHIAGRQLLVAYFEGEPVANMEVFGPWVAARDRLYFVYLT